MPLRTQFYILPHLSNNSLKYGLQLRSRLQVWPSFSVRTIDMLISSCTPSQALAALPVTTAARALLAPASAPPASTTPKPLP